MNFVDENQLSLIIRVSNYPFKDYEKIIDFASLHEIGLGSSDTIKNLIALSKKYHLPSEKPTYKERRSSSLSLDDLDVFPSMYGKDETPSAKQELLKKIKSNDFSLNELEDFIKLAESDSETRDVRSNINFRIFLDDQSRDKIFSNLGEYIQNFIDGKLKPETKNYPTFENHKSDGLKGLDNNILEYGNEFVATPMGLFYERYRQYRFLEFILSLHKLGYIEVLNFINKSKGDILVVGSYDAYAVKIKATEKLVSEAKATRDNEIKQILEKIPKKYQGLVESIIKKNGYKTSGIGISQEDLEKAKSVSIPTNNKVRVCCPLCGKFIIEIKKSEEFESYLKKFQKDEFLSCRNGHRVWFLLRDNKITVLSVPEEVGKISVPLTNQRG